MKKLMILLVLALAAMALAACGDDNGTTTTDTGAETTGAAAEAEEEAGGGGAGGGLTVKFEADPEGGLAYTSTEETAEAGNVTIDLINSQALAHDVAIEDSNGEQIGKTDVITEGEDSATVELEPGEYTFYCTVPGHREAGMEGTLTVE